MFSLEFRGRRRQEERDLLHPAGVLREGRRGEGVVRGGVDVEIFNFA